MLFLTYLPTNYFCNIVISLFIFPLANFLHSQTIWFTLSPHYLHNGDSHGLAVNMVSVRWLVLRACSWPEQISASVWIFESAFCSQLQVFLLVLFLVFLIKLTMQLFFPSNCRVSAHCSKMSSINLTDNFLTFNIPYPLPLAVKRPKNSSHTTQNCFTHLSHTPHSLLVGPTSILP